MGSASALRGRTVLIVEDECLIALDVAGLISAAGAHSVITTTVEQALRALARAKFAVAIIDHRLGDDDACEVIRLLEKLRIPFLIYSGYDEAAAWANAPVVRKPATHEHLLQTVTDLLG
jgi:DNA-binding NtrC family response regulator